MFLKVPQNTRYEIKFVAYEHNYYSVLNWLKLHKLNFKKKYAPRFVNNVYFDSHNYNSYKSNMFGDSSRIKLRYRWYGDLEDINNGVFEFKYKRNLYGWKKKFNMQNFNFTEKSLLKNFSNTISKYLPDKEKIFFKANSNPKIINRYFRDYFTNHDDEIRITIDRFHEIFDQRYSNNFNFRKKTYSQRIVVMEFKFERGNKNFVDELMKSVPIRSSRNSKYVNSIRAVTGL